MPSISRTAGRYVCRHCQLRPVLKQTGESCFFLVSAPILSLVKFLYLAVLRYTQTYRCHTCPQLGSHSSSVSNHLLDVLSGSSRSSTAAWVRRRSLVSAIATREQRYADSETKFFLFRDWDVPSAQRVFSEFWFSNFCFIARDEWVRHARRLERKFGLSTCCLEHTGVRFSHVISLPDCGYLFLASLAIRYRSALHLAYGTTLSLV